MSQIDAAVTSNAEEMDLLDLTELATQLEMRICPDADWIQRCPCVEQYGTPFLSTIGGNSAACMALTERGSSVHTYRKEGLLRAFAEPKFPKNFSLDSA